MNSISRAMMAGLVLLGLAAPPLSSPQTVPSTKSLHAPGANFQQSLGELLFSPDGVLYAAYRVPGKNKSSSTLRIVTFDTQKGKHTAVIDYPVPVVHLPRVPTHFIMSNDSSALAYAELHDPQVLLTIDAATLRLMSSADEHLFEGRDSAPHIKTFDKQSLVVTAERLGTRRPYRVTTVRDVALAPGNLNQVISETRTPPEQSMNELLRWLKLTRQELHLAIPVGRRALGFTNLLKEGWVRLFDESGKTVASVHNHDCGFTLASLTADQQFGVAVCEKVVQKQLHMQELLWRKAVVFEVDSLRIIGSFSMSHISLKEQGTDDTMWIGTPTPVIWHDNDTLLVAAPESSSTIKLHSFAIR